jgi:hypothetical protein
MVSFTIHLLLAILLMAPLHSAAKATATEAPLTDYPYRLHERLQTSCAEFRPREIKFVPEKCVRAKFRQSVWSKLEEAVDQRFCKNHRASIEGWERKAQPICLTDKLSKDCVQLEESLSTEMLAGKRLLLDLLKLYREVDPREQNGDDTGCRLVQQTQAKNFQEFFDFLQRSYLRVDRHYRDLVNSR